MNVTCNSALYSKRGIGDCVLSSAHIKFDLYILITKKLVFFFFLGGEILRSVCFGHGCTFNVAINIVLWSAEVSIAHQMYYGLSYTARRARWPSSLVYFTYNEYFVLKERLCYAAECGVG